MPDIFYGRSAYNRSRGNLPELPLINLFAEASASDKQGIVLQSRRGLKADIVVGSGPIRNMFRRDGALGGVRVSVSGYEVYAGATLLGTITGDGPVSMAASETELLIAAGAALYRSDGVSLTAVDFPDGASVVKIAFLAGYFVALRKDTQQFYWSGVLNGSSWNGLDFASAENEPDRLLDCLVLDDILVLFGSETVEFWPKTGDADIPFAPTQGRVFQQGIADTGCAVATDNSFFWIGNDRITYRNGDIPVAIDDDGIVERVKYSTSGSMFLIEDDRHKFLCLRLGGFVHPERPDLSPQSFTMAFDVTTQEWCEFQTWGRPTFRAQCAIFGPYLGDDETGQIWAFSGYQEAGGVLERRLRGGFSLVGGSLSMDNVRVRADTGQTPFLTGDYANPVVEMRFSNDYGQTWSDWEAEPLGTQGAYRTIPEWRALGMADAPGILFEWRTTDPVPFRFSGAGLNDQWGGLAR